MKECNYTSPYLLGSLQFCLTGFDFIYPQILNGFDPLVDPYFWPSKTTDRFKSITDSDLTAALNTKINEKFVASQQESRFS